MISGFADPEASATVTASSTTSNPPTVRRTPDPWPQRRFDALVLLCERARGARWPSPDRSPGAELVVSDDVLAGHPLTDLDGLQCEIEGFGPISRGTAERLLCDCAMGRHRDAGPQPDPRPRSPHPHRPRPTAPSDHAPRRTLPVPRLSRTGLVVRRPPPGVWSRAVTTSLENLALLCRRHHVAVHEGGWKLARGPNGLTLAA